MMTELAPIFAIPLTSFGTRVRVFVEAQNNTTVELNANYRYKNDIASFQTTVLSAQYRHYPSHNDYRRIPDSINRIPIYLESNTVNDAEARNSNNVSQIHLPPPFLNSPLNRP